MGSTVLFGGSFDPVHKGHVSLAKTMMSRIPDAERLIVIPAAVSPFKQGRGHIDGAHRLEMCRLAFEEIPSAEVSDHEISKGGVSYTYETLEHFSSLYPEDKLYMIMGSDSLKTLPDWKNFSRIMELCIPAAAARSDEDRRLIEEYKKAVLPYGEVLTADAEPFEISSTELRQMIAENKDVSAYIPQKAALYIKENHLYT